MSPGTIARARKPGEKENSMRKRQVVLITADTQRRDMLGCYYGGCVRTPSLDRLAAEGMLFERAYY